MRSLRGRREGWGKHFKKSFAQKIFPPTHKASDGHGGLNPSTALGTGLTLHARACPPKPSPCRSCRRSAGRRRREARGVAKIQWASIAEAYQKNSKTTF
ncbi:MAG: hypothetical protein AUJ39_01755 [Parcubacteria group bacterium CG1_02_42_13]|nr:MAG: hypothetical protein AUJ39_01755 [Parcubacteria group bacterium CG1_02_42_13]